MISGDDFVKVCHVNELQERKGRRFFVNETDVALFKVDGKIFALCNVCPHQKSAMIYDGFIEEGKVVCPLHGWEFLLETGKLPSGANGLGKYEVKVENDFVFVKAFPKDFNW